MTPPAATPDRKEAQSNAEYHGTQLSGAIVVLKVWSSSTLSAEPTKPQGACSKFEPPLEELVGV